MADRKQTPDILTEVMSGTLPALAHKPVEVNNPPVLKPTRSSKRVSKSPGGTRGTLWEYQLVSFQDYRGYRPRFVNGAEINNWMDAPLTHEYLNQMAEQGWELAAASCGQRMYGLSDTRQLYFRRPRVDKSE
jgi:hypothetical protein